MNNRLTKLTNWLQAEHLDFAFISSTDNVFYLTNFHCDPHERLLGLFVFPHEEPILVCPKMELEQVKSAGWNYETIGYTDTDNPWKMVQQSLTKRNVNGEHLAIEIEHMNVSRYETLKTLFPHATFVPAETKLHELRMLKDKKEFAILQEAAAYADIAIDIGVSAIKEGATELEILAKIEYELKKKGIHKMAFSTMVLTGANSALPHGVPGANKITKGDFVLFDLGVIIDGYCSDITRTVAFGHVTEQQKEIYHTVLQAEQAAIEACKLGTLLKDLDNTARSIITQAGYGDYFPHRLGHGLGIGVHEFPSLKSDNDMPLQEGMCFTIEPGIYVPKIGGVRIEDDIFMTNEGPHILTAYPKELVIVS
ncbi:M24 family metallopeptidase [Priestia taiwanensis]|uniref:Xaa-Pro dipeptidase n=1 Tax=Priestia taiwanensis TaxID=1347902 RepID=A0A917ET63_9BACI|nr:Xaa-Pro peptidase family protein [Priestia taiwanensis]MBM7363453.1 Xaa-Pro dipeptidase [Priestia taiwanensis]GGE77023.1 Xaa-Pro dipeptidase [Priestia taiwanensis]